MTGDRVGVYVLIFYFLFFVPHLVFAHFTHKNTTSHNSTQQYTQQHTQQHTTTTHTTAHTTTIHNNNAQQHTTTTKIMIHDSQLTYQTQNRTKNMGRPCVLVQFLAFFEGLWYSFFRSSVFGTVFGVFRVFGTVFLSGLFGFWYSFVKNWTKNLKTCAKKHKGAPRASHGASLCLVPYLVHHYGIVNNHTTTQPRKHKISPHNQQP